MSLVKAFGYLRVSGLGQVDGDGFPRQRQTITQYAVAHGIKIVRWFEEQGVSGKNDLENRPSLLALMVALHSNGTKLVLIEKLDRLARDLMVQESIVADLRERGFRLISALEPDLCSDDPTRKLMRQMMGAFAEYERTMIVTKLRAARRRARAKNGRCEGRKPYGEHPQHPGEKATALRMNQLRKEGASYQAICQALNDDGITTRCGGAWTPMTVSRIVGRSLGA